MINQSRFYTLCANAFVFVEVMLVNYVDQPLSEYLRTIDPAITDFFSVWTDAGKSKWYLWPSGFGVILCSILMRRKGFKKAVRNRLQKTGEFLLFLFLCVAASGIITDIIKPIAGRARPVELQEHTLYGFHPLSFAARWNSMPSGHATTAFALACVVALSFPRLRIPAFILGVCLALSRVVVNAHFLSDVLAGAMVGILTVAGLQWLKAHNGICHINKRIFPIDGKAPKR